MLHVTLTTLHNQLDLGEQLLKKKLEERQDDRTRQISGHSMRLHGGRPGRTRQRRLSSSDGKFCFPSTHHINLTSMSMNFPNISTFSLFLCNSPQIFLCLAHVDNPKHKWSNQMSVDESSSSVYTPNLLRMRQKIVTIAEGNSHLSLFCDCPCVHL
jgi:hypothetical protein